MTTLYRNINTGETYDVDLFADDVKADVVARPNFVEVDEDEAKVPFARWAPSVPAPVDAPEVLGKLEDGLIPRDGQPGPVDVPQSGPTGSKARGNRAPDKPTSPAPVVVVPPAPAEIGNPDGKQLKPGTGEPAGDDGKGKPGK